MSMVEKMHPDAQRSETETTAPFLSMLLEVKAPNRAESFMIPVKLQNLYQGMVVLGIDSPMFINPQTLRGKHATLRLTDPESQKSMHIDGLLNLTPSHKEIYLTLRYENVQKNKPAIKILENSLPFASKDIQRLWSLWDKSQEGALSLGYATEVSFPPQRGVEAAALAPNGISLPSPEILRVSARNCPRCGRGFPTHLRRKLWMRLLPACRYYKCIWCSMKFLAVYKWTIRWGKVEYYWECKID